jgi:integrase
MSDTPEAPQLSVLERAVANATDLHPRTKALYLECVRSFLLYAPDPSNWTVGTVEDWLASLLATRKPQTVRVYRKGIRYASKRYAKREKKEDFASQADAIKADAPVRKPILDMPELQKLLRTCEGRNRTAVDIRDYALIVVAARTGLRRGGMAALEFTEDDDDGKP